jgi:RNA polymerase sigma-70 factor (ECF subfamily)
MKQRSLNAEATQRFEQLYDENRIGILGFFLRRVNGSPDAADLLAETFLVGWRRIDDVPPKGEDRLWLFGVARRVLLNYRRHERVENNLAAKLKLELRQHVFEANADEAPFGAVMEEAMTSLSATDREIIELSAWEQLTPSEIATVIGMKPGLVRVRLHRARKSVGAQLTIAGYRPPAQLDCAG